MSTIIRIDPDDELPAILERLPAGGSCVLVLPPHARALNSIVGAKLLSRRAAALGSNVAVVTDDHAVMAHARAAGVAVAETVDGAQRLLGVDPPVDDADETVVWRPGAADGGPDSPTLLLDTAQSPGAAPAKNVTGAANGAAYTDPDGADGAGIRGHSGGARAASGRRGGTAPPPPPPPPSRPRSAGTGRRGPGNWLVTAAVVLVPLALLALIANYVLGGILNPSATLTVSPRAVIVPAAATVHAVRHLPVKKRGPYLVAMADASQAVTATVPLPVRGHKLVPGHMATGRLLLGNLTTKSLLVPRGTTFTTVLNKVAFVSTQDVTLPAAVESFTMTVYGTGYVPIRAVVGGSDGNVPSKAIINVPASLSGASLSGALKVENLAPTHGGTDKSVPDVAPRDLTNTAASLFGALRQEALQDIARRHGGDVEVHALSVAESPVVPRLAPDRRSAALTLSVDVQAVYVYRHDLMPAVSAALKPVLDTMPGATLMPSRTTWTAAWSPGDPITQTIALTITGRASRPLDIAALRGAISGKSKAAALSYLRTRPDVASANIKLDPPWADTVPSDVTRIHVIPGTVQ